MSETSRIMIKQNTEEITRLLKSIQKEINRIAKEQDYVASSRIHSFMTDLRKIESQLKLS